MNLIDWLVLKMLRLDTKKINIWLENKNVHTIESYRKIDEKWVKKSYQDKEKLKELELKEKKIKNSKDHAKKLAEIYQKLKKLRKKQKTLKKKWDKGQILFDSFSEFRKFSWWLALFHMGYLKLTKKNIKHEKEHAQVYEKQGIMYQFGWTKLLDKKHKKYIYGPFVTASAPNKVHLEAVKAVSNLSGGDKSTIKRSKI